MTCLVYQGYCYLRSYEEGREAYANLWLPRRAPCPRFFILFFTKVQRQQYFTPWLLFFSFFFSAFDIYFVCPSMANRFWATSSTSEIWRMRYFTGQTSLWGRANFYGCSDPYNQKPLTSELFVNLSKNTVSTQLTVIRVKVGYMAGYDIIYPNSLRFIFATTDYTHYY